MKITAIKKQERRDRYNVFADDKFVTALSADVLAGSGLGVGVELQPGQLDSFMERDEYSKVLAKAYDYLSRRPHTTGELRQKLLRKEDDSNLIEEALAHLAELHYLDDAGFARRWVAARGETRGPALLQQELRKKHLSAAIIKEALETDRSARDESAEAYLLARRRYERLVDEPWQSVHSKLGGYLTRRGYQYDTVRDVLAKLKAESREVTG